MLRYFFTFFFGTGTTNPSTYDMAIILSVVGSCSQKDLVDQEWQQEGVVLPRDSYSLWRFTQGNSRRSALTMSRMRVSAFSFLRWALRALSHSSRETTRCWCVLRSGLNMDSSSFWFLLAS